MSLVCGVDECNNPVICKGLCSRHYKQLSTYGHVLKRTTHDRNEIIINKDYAEVMLYDKQCNEIARALIDIEDIEKIKPFKWCLIKEYVYAQINNKNTSLHRYLLNNPSNEFDIDHINQNPLDNRKINLRICTRSQNNINSRARHGKGIYWCKQKNKWHVRIWINKQSKHIGYFADIDEARTARLEAEKLYYGEFACREN